MTTIAVSAMFTKNSGQPATGLALSDIAFNLVSRKKSDGSILAIWSGVNPTEEITGCGMYSKSYTSADMDTYDYYLSATYSGATALDSNYSSGGLGEDKQGYTLSATGLDAISVTTPSTVASTFPQMVIQLFRRFFYKSTLTSTELKTYADDGGTVITTQQVADDGSVQTLDRAI